MDKTKKHLFEELNKNGVRFLVLEDNDHELRVLTEISRKKDFRKACKKLGLKRLKDKSGDLYLYGMEHFEYFAGEKLKVVMCCQVACRSTLNGEWVPLDRCINLSALNDAVQGDGADALPVLCPVDMICYLLAKGVYTQEHFDDNDIERINEAIKSVTDEDLMRKLKMVFFSFASKMLELVKEGKFDSLRSELWQYSEY